MVPRVAPPWQEQASSMALASCRAAVSKPLVPQPETAASNWRAFSRVPCCGHPAPRTAVADREKKDLTATWPCGNLPSAVWARVLEGLGGRAGHGHAVDDDVHVGGGVPTPPGAMERRAQALAVSCLVTASLRRGRAARAMGMRLATATPEGGTL